MEEDFANFIDERINSEYNKLRQTNKWQENLKKYDTAYSNFYEQLNEKQRKQFDEIMDIKNLLMSYESQFSYKLGFTDFIKSLKWFYKR